MLPHAKQRLREGRPNHKQSGWFGKGCQCRRGESASDTCLAFCSFSRVSSSAALDRDAAAASSASRSFLASLQQIDLDVGSVVNSKDYSLI